jgi:hypothetical protein
MLHGAPHWPPRWLWGALAALGLCATGELPAGIAGPPGNGAGKARGGQTTRELLIPERAEVVKGTQKPGTSGGAYHIQAGGKLLAGDHGGTFFVEPGGTLETTGSFQVVIVKRGGKATLKFSTLHLFHEKGAEIRKEPAFQGAQGAWVAHAYDRITFRPFQPFTLRAAVTDIQGWPAAGVKVHAFGLARKHLATATSAADGTVTFRPKEGVAVLAADFGSNWVCPAPPGYSVCLEEREHLGVLEGSEVALVRGSWGGDGLVRLAHPGVGPLRMRERGQFPGPEWGDGHLTFSADGRFLASERDRGKVSVWDLTTGAELATVVGFGQVRGAPREWISGIALSPDGKLVAVARENGAVHVWGTAGGKKLHTLRGHQGGANCVLFAPDGRTLLSGGDDALVRTWDLATGKVRSSFKAHAASVQRLTFSPDGKTLATGGNIATPIDMGTVHHADAVRLWDRASGRELQSFPGECGSLAFSPDGRLLAWGGVSMTVSPAPGKLNNMAYYLFGLRDTLGGGERFRKAGLGSRVAFTPDGRTLVSAGQEGARLWEVASGQEIVCIPLPFPAWKVWEPALGPGARQLAAVVREHTIHVWDLSWEGLYGHRPPAGPEAWGRAWEDLAGGNAAAAYEGIWALAAGGDKAVAFLGERLKPAPARQLPLGRLLADLSSPRFAVREAASRALKQLGAPAEAALRAALDKQPPLETRARIEAVLAALARQPLSPEELRQLRAVQALERVGTPAARRVLESLAAGCPVARQTREARAALARLPRKAAQGP